MAQPLMPKATAVWLIENTALTFDQIADFCGLHPLEVQGIADGEVAQGIVGLDPVANGQVTQEDIERCQADPQARLTVIEQPELAERKGRRAPRYTPISRRQDRPDAIAWLVRHHPELTDAQIAKLVGTTKPTIIAVRERTHWNSTNITPRDPVTLGLCTQMELDQAVRLAAERVEKQRLAEEKRRAKLARERATLTPVESLEEPPLEPTAEDAEAALEKSAAEDEA